MDLPILPYDIISDILSRLPAKDVTRCKCACKSWLKLTETPEFAKDHLSRSIPCLIVLMPDAIKLFEFVDELELGPRGLHYNLMIDFHKTALTGTSPYHCFSIHGTVNGLLLFNRHFVSKLRGNTTFYVCNPITREYIKLPSFIRNENRFFEKYGFGISVTSGLYKVIRILMEYERYGVWGTCMRVIKLECWVYTLGEEEWKKISILPWPFLGHGESRNVFFNGSLHWLVQGNSGRYLISCFDLETEVFTTFSPPPTDYKYDPAVFDNCLCIFEDTLSDRDIVIWVMKEYGNDKSWTKQFSFRTDSDLHNIYVNPLKVFKDGNVLLQWGYEWVLYYSKKTNTTEKLDLFELQHQQRTTSIDEAWVHVSSFVSLSSLAAKEDVRKL